MNVSPLTPGHRISPLTVEHRLPTTFLQNVGSERVNPTVPSSGPSAWYLHPVSASRTFEPSPLPISLRGPWRACLVMLDEGCNLSIASVSEAYRFQCIAALVFETVPQGDLFWSSYHKNLPE